MTPSRTVLKSVTPDSVKALMILEAIVIAFFSFWLANEYNYNAYFRTYVFSAFVEHLTTYTIALGLGIGLAGTAVAAVLYRTMLKAKVKIQTVAPKIRGTVEKILATVPAGEPGMPAPATNSTTAIQLVPVTPMVAPTQAPLDSSRPQTAEEKK